MLYWLLFEKLFPHFGPARLFGYVTFRTAFASLSALFISIWLGPWLIRKLREFQIGPDEIMVTGGIGAGDELV